MFRATSSPPWSVSLLHAGLGPLGLILLIAASVEGSVSQAVLIGFVILLAAALGGLSLPLFICRKRLPPKAVVLAQTGVALVGFLTIPSQVF